MARRGQRLQMRPNPPQLPPHPALPPVRAGRLEAFRAHKDTRRQRLPTVRAGVRRSSRLTAGRWARRRCWRVRVRVRRPRVRRPAASVRTLEPSRPRPSASLREHVWLACFHCAPAPAAPPRLPTLLRSNTLNFSGPPNSGRSVAEWAPSLKRATDACVLASNNASPAQRGPRRDAQPLHATPLAAVPIPRSRGPVLIYLVVYAPAGTLSSLSRPSLHRRRCRKARPLSRTRPCASPPSSSRGGWYRTRLSTCPPASPATASRRW